MQKQKHPGAGQTQGYRYNGNNGTEGGGVGTYQTSQLRICPQAGQQQDPKQQQQQPLPGGGMQHISYAPSRQGGYVNQFHPQRGGSSHTQRMAPQPRPNMSLMSTSYSVPPNPMVQTYIPGGMPGQVIVPSNMTFPQPTRHQSHGTGTPNAGPTSNFIPQNCSFYIQNPQPMPSFSHYPPAMYTTLPVRNQQAAPNSTQYSQQQQQSQAVPQLMGNPQNQGLMALSMPPAQVSAMGMQHQQPVYQPQKERKKRVNALPIINPESGLDITDELYNEKELQSNDSAASPQPMSIQEEAAERAYIASQIASKVAAEFASKVAVAVSSNNSQNIDELAPNGPTSRSITPPAPIKIEQSIEPPPPVPKPAEPIPTVSAKTNSPTVELHRPPVSKQPPVSSTHFVQHNPPPHVIQAPSPPLQRPPSPPIPIKIDPAPRQPSPPRKPVQPQYSEPKPKRKDDKKREAPRPVQQPPPSTSPVPPKRDPSPKKSSFAETPVTRSSPTPPPLTPTPPPVLEDNINGEADPEAGIYEKYGHDRGFNKNMKKNSRNEHTEKGYHREVGKALQRPKQKKKHLNKKGDEKEGTDMDAFVALAEPSSQITTEIEDKDDIEEKTSIEVETMVAVKNEENLNNIEPEVDENVIESMTIERSAPALQFNYKDDQWSPINLQGKKVYDREFLMEVRRHPLSTKKPENLISDCDLFRDRPNDMSNRKLQSNSMNLSRGDNSPSFLRASSSQRGPLQNKGSRNMGPGRMPGGSIGHGSFSRMQKPGYSSMNSYRDEVQLHTVANSWKPTRFLNNNNLSEEEVKTENLLKTMRGILNKLTPQKFTTLLGKVDKLEIDNEDRLGKVVTLVFEKAIDEPSFSSMYAELCYNIQNKKVPVHENKEEGAQNAKELMFRKVLLSRCQEQFEKTKGDQLDIATRTNEIQETKDPEKKKELKLALDEDERKIRVKAVGLVRFIGELYKKNMLTHKIMHECIGVLLAKVDEEPLECLCKLLTTVGKDLEQKSGTHDMNDYFATMLKLSQKSSDSKISSRIRFMLQDVIELRANKWIPRRDENKPKTIEQIQKDAERETIMESNFYSPAMSSGGGNRGKHTNDDRRRTQKNQVNEEGWSNVYNKNNLRSAYQFDSSKIINIRGNSGDVEELGTASQFSQWSVGASTKKSDNNSKLFSNKYAALRVSDDEKKMPIISSMGKKMTPSPSVEKERMIAGVRQNMRGGSGPSSRENSRQRYGNSPATSINSEREERPQSGRENIEKSPQIELMSDDSLVKKLKVVLEEWFSNQNVDETCETIEESFPGPNLRRFIHKCLAHIIENLKPEKMANFSKLLVIIIKNKKIVPKKDVVDGFSEIMANEDLVIDLPLIWVYLAQFLVPLIAQEAFDFRDVMTAAKSTKKENLSILIVEIITRLIREKGPSWIRTQWEASQVQIKDFIPDNEDKDKFLTEKGIGFVFGHGECSIKPVDSLASQDIEEKLISFLSLDSNKAFDHACDWIKVNVPDRLIQSNDFVKAVTRAAIKCSIVKDKFCSKSFDSNKNLIIKFVDNDEKRELACLSALENLLTVELVNVLSSTMICEIFDMLYNAGTISHDGFMKWKSMDSDGAIQPQGRGVLMKILPPFFVMLSENINDTEEES